MWRHDKRKALASDTEKQRRGGTNYSRGTQPHGESKAERRFRSQCNHRPVSSISVLQIPDAITETETRVGESPPRIKTIGNRNKRKAVHSEAKERGIQMPLAHHLRLFSREELVMDFVKATPERECLEDLHKAGQQEMMYTIEQGDFGVMGRGKHQGSRAAVATILAVGTPAKVWVVRHRVCSILACMHS